MPASTQYSFPFPRSVTGYSLTSASGECPVAWNFKGMSATATDWNPSYSSGLSQPSGWTNAGNVFCGNQAACGSWHSDSAALGSYVVATTSGDFIPRQVVITSIGGSMNPLYRLEGSPDGGSTWVRLLTEGDWHSSPGSNVCAACRLF